MFTGPQQQADHPRVLALVEEALTLFEQIGNRSGIGRSHWALINSAYFDRGDIAGANAHLVIALEIFQELDDRFMLGWALFEKGLLFLDETVRDIPVAAKAVRDALSIFVEAGDVSGYTLVLDAAAQVAVAAGRTADAARLSGAVERLERETGTGLTIPNRQYLGFDPQSLRDDPQTSEAWQEGAAMTTDEVVAFARELLESI
jgi:hypothetical protein